jgi:hypothetical protein
MGDGHPQHANGFDGLLLQVREVFKNILPNILMSSGPTYATIPAHKLATREHALAFVTYVPVLLMGYR